MNITPDLKPLPPLDEDEQIEAPQMNFEYLLEDTVFFCDYPLLDLEQRITEQFSNLIDLEDDTDFFQVALNGFKYSLEVINTEFDEYTLERREILRNKYFQFINFMINTIEEKLTISIPDYETGLISRQETEYLIEKLYRFFVLKARKNFKKVIAKQLEKQLKPYEEDATKYLEKAQELIQDYFAIITTIDCETFLRTLNEQEIWDLYENGVIAGNFLRRYSARLYRHPDFVVEILNQVMIDLYFKNDTKEYLAEEAKIQWPKTLKNKRPQH